MINDCTIYSIKAMGKPVALNDGLWMITKHIGKSQGKRTLKPNHKIRVCMQVDLDMWF